MKAASCFVLLARSLIHDCVSQMGSTVRARRDVQEIERRFKHEGLSFLTITLPKFLDEFHIALEKGSVASNAFPGWRKRQCLPVFLQGFTRLVFNAQDGRVLDDADTMAIRSVRQLCTFFKKVKIDCAPKRVQETFNRYIETDNDIRNVVDNCNRDLLDSFAHVSRIVVGSCFGDEIDYSSLIPRHGPGSTAERITGNRKYTCYPDWPVRLEPYFRADCLFSSEECFNLAGVDINSVEPDSELPVRVVAVPKTQKGPRVIAMEPVVMQYVQQAVKDYMVNRIESKGLTAGHVNFTDQTINQQLALRSSKSRRHATLDLSEASDRVHNGFVLRMFQINPVLSDLIQCTRSLKACLPTGEVVMLNKFASMGSALCFPVESLFFFIIVILARLKHNKLPVTYKNIKNLVSDIYVYGDDIICPVDEVETVISLLHDFGNKVGLTKSFWRGRFRESCGVDAWNGSNITPIYMRNPIPDSRRDATAVISAVSTANQLYDSHYFSTYETIKSLVEEKIRFNLPYVDDRCSGLGWRDSCHNTTRFRIKANSNKLSNCYQCKEVLTLVPEVIRKKDPLDGYAALHKCLQRMELRSKIPPSSYDGMGEERADIRHLVETPRRGAVTLKRRWVPA